MYFLGSLGHQPLTAGAQGKPPALRKRWSRVVLAGRAATRNSIRAVACAEWERERRRWRLARGGGSTTAAVSVSPSGGRWSKTGPEGAAAGDRRASGPLRRTGGERYASCDGQAARRVEAAEQKGAAAAVTHRIVSIVHSHGRHDNASGLPGRPAALPAWPLCSRSAPRFSLADAGLHGRPL